MSTVIVTQASDSPPEAPTRDDFRVLRDALTLVAQRLAFRMATATLDRPPAQPQTDATPGVRRTFRWTSASIWAPATQS